jgi:RHS repeat-associated protein
VQAYGGAESDYRPGRWKEFREDYRFTGKEEDVEVGLQYFGKRFYAPLLQRWVSADPLAIHAPGDDADLNVYAYVRGMALKAIDPLGLQESILAEDVELNGGQSIDPCSAAGACQGKASDAPNASTAPPARATPGPATGSGSGGTGATIDEKAILAQFDPQTDRFGNLTSLKAPRGGVVAVNLMEERLERLMSSGGEQGASGSGELPQVPRLELEIAKFEPVIIEAAAPDPRRFFAQQALHGNSKLSLKLHHRYEIVENSTKDVVKTGISGQPLTQSGTSPRARPQLKDLNKTNEGAYSARVVETDIPGRQVGLDAERAATTKLSKEGNSLRLQKRPKPDK